MTRTTANIEDVAARAGVSVATVSRALRGLPNVAEGTRARVRLAAEALQYRPDPNASRLATGRTMTVGMAVPMLAQWYFGQVMAGAEAVLAAEGYDLMLMSVGTGEERRRFIKEWALLRKRVDGLVLVDLRLDPDELIKLREVRAHVTTVGDSYPDYPSVVVDNRTASAAAVRHLLTLGHRRIGLIKGHDHWRRDADLAGLALPSLRFDVPNERRLGFEDAHLELGLTSDPALKVAGDFTIAGGAEAFQRMLDSSVSGSPPTALFAMSDEMALGAMRVARERGLRIPGDLSVIGFDDHELAAAVGLSTVRQPVVESGARAARLLVDVLAGSVEVAHDVMATELIIRETTSAPMAKNGARS